MTINDKKTIPTVSVIMPLYNAEDWLAETINSIINQTMQSWELIVVDDKSIDNGLSIAQSFALKDNRIRVEIAEINSGTASVPRNRGLKLARGRYTTFIDADDLYHPQRLEKLVEVFDEYEDVNIVVNDFFRFKNDISSPDGCSRFEHVLRHWPKDTYWDSQNKSLWISTDKGFRYSVVYSNVVWTGGIIFRTKILKDENVYFDESMQIGEDEDFWFRLMYRHKTAFLPAVLSYYRIHSTGLTGNSTRYLKGAVAHQRRINENYRKLLTEEENLFLKKKLSERLFSLGWHFRNDGHAPEARSCYRESFCLYNRWKALFAIFKTYIPKCR